MDSIYEIVRKAQDNYKNGTVKLGEYVDFSMRDTVEKIIAYVNSKHISGSKDSLGRDKPFFNIVTAAVNIWYRATDLDRKDIVIVPTKQSDTVAAFLATLFLKQWMNKHRFGVFLNEWGRTLAKFGSAIVETIEVNGDLNISVLPWNKTIVDPIDFSALPVIKLIHKTPAQLRKMTQYNQDVVENLIKTRESRKTLDGQKVDNRNDFIELYEVHGELPLALLKDNSTNDDWKTYVQQMHVISYVKQSDKFHDFSLYRGKEKNPEMITHLINEEGRTLAIGAVESLFDAQWMQNHTIKNMKDTLDLASKMIFQTSDSNFLNRNVLSAIETGDILINKENTSLTLLNNIKPDIVALQNFSTQWKVLSQEVTSTPESLRGTNPPSTTPLGTTQIVTAQGLSLFEVMTENKALALEDLLRTYIIPHLKKQMKNKKELMAVLEDADLKKIDSIYIPKAAVARYNSMAKEAILNGQIPPSFNKQAMETQVQQDLSTMGNSRSFNPEDLNWDEVFKDLEWKVDVGITNESFDKQTLLTTLNTILQTIGRNPAVLTDPNAKLIFNKILSMTGVISPIEMTAPAPQAPINKVSESISFKDLPPAGKISMAKQAGIELNPQELSMIK